MKIVIDIDTMVLNNDDAKKRHGCDVSYKKCKGCKPLQITWNNLVIYAHFRRGSAHSNHGTDVKKALKRIVTLIRKQYRNDVPIILTCDSGFLDEKNLTRNKIIFCFSVGTGICETNAEALNILIKHWVFFLSVLVNCINR